MSTHRETAEPRRYQGRVLPRQQDDLEDQGLAFDMATLLGRRQVLRVFGLGAGSLALAACGSQTSSETSTSSSATSSSASATTSSSADSSLTASAEIPDETAGPYPGDGSNGPNVLTESGIVRQDIRSSFGTGSATAEGVPLTIELVISDLTAAGAMAGAAVYAWHCNREGEYSLYSSGLENENYLRGVQVADADGVVRFTSIFPGCYSGRWPHIHFEVYPDQDSITDSANAIATSQVALPQDACETVYATSGYEASVTNLSRITLATDNVFGNDSAALQLGQVTGDVDAGYTVTLPVGIDTTTVPTAAAAPGGDGQPGGPPPGN
ncbi:MAG: intradiol ring-cleavage dioxygenase [Actinomycetales bacterium]